MFNIAQFFIGDDGKTARFLGVDRMTVERDSLVLEFGGDVPALAKVDRELSGTYAVTMINPFIQETVCEVNECDIYKHVASRVEVFTSE